MQINDLKLNSPRKKRKIIGRGGKKGTYCGRGMNGQKSRSGASVDPLFEGGRSTLIDHMKKKKGFKSRTPKKNIIKLADLEIKFQDGDEINQKTLVKSGLISKMKIIKGVKILGSGELTKKLSIASGILVTISAKKAIEKAGGKIIFSQSD